MQAADFFKSCCEPGDKQSIASMHACRQQVEKKSCWMSSASKVKSVDAGMLDNVVESAMLNDLTLLRLQTREQIAGEMSKVS
jgi:hypothetical protein